LYNDGKRVCKLYADDLKLYSILETDVDISYLQDKLTNAYDWSDKWQLGISFSKCNVMYVGRTSCNANLSLNVNMLPVLDRVKDLRVIIDSHLTFTYHIDETVARAFTHANLIYICFVSSYTASSTLSFIVYVRPLLEYASPVWSPQHVDKIMQIESV